MSHRIYINTEAYLPRTITLDEPFPAGKTLSALVFGQSPASQRGNFGFAYTHAMNRLMETAEKQESITLIVDELVESRNVNRFDHFEEQWIRIFRGNRETSKFVSVRNCADDYNTWVQIYYYNEENNDLQALCTGLEAACDYIQLEDGRILPETLLETLPELNSIEDVAALMK